MCYIVFARTSTFGKTDIFSALRCDGETECTLEPTDEKLGDPCPGMFKTLEVVHNCVRT